MSRAFVWTREMEEAHTDAHPRCPYHYEPCPVHTPICYDLWQFERRRMCHHWLHIGRSTVHVIRHVPAWWQQAKEARRDKGTP